MYEQFFGLEDEPFRLTPDPRYLFLSPKHAEALAHLRLGLSESSGFVCITGDVGTGKTTLLRAFLAELGGNVTAAYTVLPPVSAFELLCRICRAFGLPASGQTQGELVDELHAYLLAQHQAGQVSVVILDEAQALSIELLEQIRLLLNLETETQKLLRIILVGQPQLRKLLLHPELAQLNQRITLRWHLGPLSHRETAGYVDHRVAVASGNRTARLFTGPALRLLHSVSGGVPRLINMVAHRALLATFVARETRVTRRFVARAYHEIQAVPLPGTLSLGRKVAWAVAGLTIGIALVAFAGPPLDRLLNPPPAVTMQSEPRQWNGADEPGALARVATAPTETPPHVGPPPTSAKIPPAAPATTWAATASVEEVTRRLAALDADASANRATDAVLAAWGERPLTPDELHVPVNLEAIAWRRGLQVLSITGNRSMLRLLDLPAMTVLRLPDSSGLRYAALTAMDGSRANLLLDGIPTTVGTDLFEHYWSGTMYVLWRDFEGLGPTLRAGGRGPAVVRLQQLLRRVGLFATEPTGVFDAATEQGVVSFQRSHFLDPDRIAGPFTDILLYAAAGGYVRPRLTSDAQAGL
jgi:general secretion pathway protein A